MSGGDDFRMGRGTGIERKSASCYECVCDGTAIGGYLCTELIRKWSLNGCCVLKKAVEGCIPVVDERSEE